VVPVCTPFVLVNGASLFQTPALTLLPGIRCNCLFFPGFARMDEPHPRQPYYAPLPIREVEHSKRASLCLCVLPAHLAGFGR